jgi:hypothetical protein
MAAGAPRRGALRGHAVRVRRLGRCHRRPSRQGEEDEGPEDEEEEEEAEEEAAGSGTGGGGGGAGAGEGEGGSGRSPSMCMAITPQPACAALTSASRGNLWTAVRGTPGVTTSRL